MILYYSSKFHFIIINSFRVVGRGHFLPPPPPPQAEPPSKSPGGIGLRYISIYLFIYLAFSLSGLQQALLYRFVVEEVTVHNTGISLLLSTSVWVLLSPPIERRETRPTDHGRCGERRSPKVQPSTRPGIEPGTFWLAVRDLTNCANLAHTYNTGGAPFSTWKRNIFLCT